MVSRGLFSASVSVSANSRIGEGGSGPRWGLWLYLTGGVSSAICGADELAVHELSETASSDCADDSEDEECRLISRSVRSRSLEVACLLCRDLVDGAKPRRVEVREVTVSANESGLDVLEESERLLRRLWE